MRLHRLLAAGAAVLAVAHLVGRWYASPILPAAAALAWFAAAGYALLAPDLAAPRTRHGLAVALAALGALELPTDADRPGGLLLSPVPPADPGPTGAEAWRWAALVVAGVALAVAVHALPRREPDRRRTVFAAVLAVVALALALLRGPTDVLPAYALLAGLAVLALVRTGSVAVVLGLGLAASAALDGPWYGWATLAHPPSTEPAAAFLSAAEYRARFVGWPPPGGAVTDALRLVGAALVLWGCRRMEGPHRRAHGAARPGS